MAEAPVESPPESPPRPRVDPATGRPWRKQRTTDGFRAILLKEFSHVRRQPTTLFFMLLVPLMQTLIFGLAINVQIEHIPTVVLDLDGRQQARDLIDSFGNTRTFRVMDRLHDDESFRRALTSGRAKVGVVIPPNYSERFINGQQAQVQVLIDGSDSTVATAALHVGQPAGRQQVVHRRPRGGRGQPDRPGPRAVRGTDHAGGGPPAAAVQPGPEELALLRARAGGHHHADGHAVPDGLRGGPRARDWARWSSSSSPPWAARGCCWAS